MWGRGLSFILVTNPAPFYDKKWVEFAYINQDQPQFIHSLSYSFVEPTLQPDIATMPSAKAAAKKKGEAKKAVALGVKKTTKTKKAPVKKTEKKKAKAVSIFTCIKSA